MKLSFRATCLILTLILALAVGAQNPGDPVPGVGVDEPFLKLIEMLKEQGRIQEQPVRVTGADFVLFDPLDPELGEFFSKMGAAIVAINAGDWRNNQAYIAMINLEQGQLVSGFGDNGVVKVDFPNNNDYVQGLFWQPDGKIVAGGYTATESITQIALARFLQNGQPDPTFGTGGYAVYSEHPDGQTMDQYNICSHIAPLYDADGGIAKYIAGGSFSSMEAAGRSLVCFDSSGNVIKLQIVSCDSNGNPITLPDVNGAVVQKPWGEITGLVPMPSGDFFAISSNLDGSRMEHCFVSPDTFEILTGQSNNPFNPDPENFPDKLVDICGGLYNPDQSTLFIGGNFRPDSQDPVYDTNIPFVSKDELDENGGFKNRELLFPPPAAYNAHEPISISDLQAPRGSP